ncbi:DUF2508 family protein [Planococcus sp. 1R117A]|uniref:DUF2508 family protein n=1 Tax=Planococcus sp. 1R117A TaxID=3447020 RepID=UPI003EDBCBF0
MFLKRGKLKKAFDEQLIRQFIETKEERGRALALENRAADHELFGRVGRKIAESNYLFLFKRSADPQCEIPVKAMAPSALLFIYGLNWALLIEGT